MNLVEVLDAIKGGAITRDLLHGMWPRVSQDAIDRHVVVLRKNRFIDENDVGRLTYIVPLSADRGTELSQLSIPEPEPPAPAVSRTSQIQPRRAAGAHPGERVMATKVCSRCEETKPVSEFYTGSARCKPCHGICQKENIARRAAAAGAPVGKAKRKYTRQSKPAERPAATKAKPNGALIIPAGTEIQAEVLRDQGVVRFIEIRSRDLSPGDEADRTWHAVKMDLYQAKRLQAWLTDVIAQ